MIHQTSERSTIVKDSGSYQQMITMW